MKIGNRGGDERGNDRLIGDPQLGNMGNLRHQEVLNRFSIPPNRHGIASKT
jgi:hypothetical protein